jgi:hypothetical protein
VDEALRMHVAPDLGDAPLLLAFDGWNDAGEAATTALRYIERALRCVPLAEIDCEEFFDFTVRRPTVRITETDTRVIDWPIAHFGYGTIDASRELVIGIAVEPHMRWRRYAKLVGELVQRIGVSQIVMLGAYLADVVYSRPVSVTGYASTPALFDKLDVAPSRYEGPTGIVGVLADELNQHGVEVVSLWAGLPHYISFSPNSRGALALLHAVTDYLDIKIDDEPLRRSATEFENRISELVASDPELGEYVRQLKRREFAQ